MQSGTSRHWARYKVARNAAVSKQRSLKVNYERKLSQKVQTNPKAYYGYVQSKRALRGHIGSLCLTGG